MNWLRRLLFGRPSEHHDLSVEYVRREQQEIEEALVALGIEVDTLIPRERERERVYGAHQHD